MRGQGAFILGCGPEASIELGLGLDHRERGEAQVQTVFSWGGKRRLTVLREPGLSLEQWGLNKFLQMSAAGPAVFVSPCIGPNSPLKGSHSLGVWLSNF